jgi:CxxC motif-containing protein (DUF1111 family)
MSTGRTIALQAAIAAIVVAGATIAQTPPQPSPPPPPPQHVPAGAPLPGLDAAALQRFNDGLEEFTNVETAETGLGPIFNNVSCVACHIAPAPGGSSPTFVTRFGHVDAQGRFDPMESLGGSLLQQFAIDPRVREVIPAAANVVARRITTPLFGAGLVEAIPDAAIALEAARHKPDGVRGRASTIIDVTTGVQRIGRFGWKAQQATLLAFAGDAYRNEMGITNRFFPTENAPNGNTALLAQFDRLPDPEDVADPATGRSDIDAAADFMRLLAPPPRLPGNPSVHEGEGLFVAIGCAQCHRPQYVAGPSPDHLFDRKPVDLYSDLLLHDMGSLADGIAQANAGTKEMRTAPLWGLHLRRAYLHDGRASTLDGAIRQHDGEARVARDRFVHLPPAQARHVLDFLGSL